MKILQNRYQTIKLTEKDSWLTIWLDRPEAKHALSNKMTLELIEILKKVLELLKGELIKFEDQLIVKEISNAPIWIDSVITSQFDG